MIPVVCSSAALMVRAQTLAARLQAPLINQWPFNKALSETYAFVLLLDQYGLALQQTGKKAPGPIRVDFLSGAVAHRRKFGGGKGQMIAKAVGLKGQQSLNLLDATAGLGKDAFVLASLGCQVTLLERSPVVAELLSDGLMRAQDGGEDFTEVLPIVQRMSFAHHNSIEFLAKLEPEAQYDVVYLDPMFPERKKSASVKKDMLAFHSVVGGDADADDLLPLAVAAARYRVVVKRPRKAPLLSGLEPSFQLSGKTSRYDIYVNEKMP